MTGLCKFNNYVLVLQISPKTTTITDLIFPGFDSRVIKPVICCCINKTLSSYFYSVSTNMHANQALDLKVKRDKGAL